MESRERSFVKYNDPLLIAVAAFILAVILILLSYFFGAGFTMEEENIMPWVMSSSTLLLYTIFNTVGLMITDRASWYWARSIYGFVGLLLSVSLICWLVTGIGIGSIGNFKSVLKVLVIAYLVIMTIGNTVRLVVRITKRQDKKKFDNEK